MEDKLIMLVLELMLYKDSKNEYELPLKNVLILV